MLDDDCVGDGLLFVGLETHEDRKAEMEHREESGNLFVVVRSTDTKDTKRYNQEREID